MGLIPDACRVPHAYADRMVERSNVGGAAFSRVVCGIDGSAEAQEASREASLLVADGAHLLLVEVLVPALVGSLATAIPGGTTVPEGAGRVAARADLERARAAIPDAVEVAVAIRVGPAGAMLQREAARVLADTLAVGGRGHGRAAGVLLGSVATQLLHSAPCSVLVARATMTKPFPQSIVVGLDGSEPSRRALQHARELAGRIGVPLRVVHILDGRLPPGALQADLNEELEEIPVSWSTSDGLSAEVTSADLLIVGSRGLRGVRALGSVSETVAHRAPSSVLVVR